MATRKPKSEAKIDPVTVASLALKRAKTKADYSRIVVANEPTTIQAAWATLSESEQAYINAICNSEPQPDLNAIANELIGCTALLQLQALKSQYGEDVVRSAWRLLPVEERRRLKAICDQKAEETPAPVIEQPTVKHTVNNQVEEPKQPKRTLFTISDDLDKLNELLDECGDDAEQQESINNWLEQLGDERDRKLDNYAALISEMLARAEVRKVEAKRMMELAASDENRAKLLKDRLKWFFESHNLKTVETARYKLSLAKNSTRPLIVDPDVSPTQLPEQFQKVSVEVHTTAIREALKQGDELPFARLGDAGHHIRVK